jgi:hypothetical protein
MDAGGGTAIRLEDGSGNEVFECVACSKTFMSEASWENHERSKKHRQAVWRCVFWISYGCALTHVSEASKADAQRRARHGSGPDPSILR